MSKRGRGRGGRGGNPSGSSRGSHRGGRGGSRNSSGRSTPARNSGKTPRSFGAAPFPSFDGHGGLGFFQGNKSKSKAPGSHAGPRNPLLEPVIFVRGSTQAFDMKKDENPEPTAEVVQETVTVEMQASVDQPEPSSVQESLPQSEGGEEPEQMEDNTFYVIDTEGDVSRNKSAQQSPGPTPTQQANDSDSEDEDKIVYIPPTQPNNPASLSRPSSSLSDKVSALSTADPIPLPTTDYARVITDDTLPVAALVAQAIERERDQPPPETSKPTREKLTYSEKRRRKREARKRRESGRQLTAGYQQTNQKNKGPERQKASNITDSESDQDDAVVQDYLLNTSRRDPDETGEMDEDPEVDQLRMLSFVNGMSEHAHTTIDDLDDAQQAAIDAQYFQERERGGWETEEEAGVTMSDGESDSSSISGSSTDSEEAEALAEVDLEVERALAEQLGLYSSEDDDEEEEDSEDDSDDEIEQEGSYRRESVGVKGRNRREVDPDGDSSDDPFAGGQSWQHDLDDAYIMDALQLSGSSKTSRKQDKQKLKALSRGQIMDLDDATELGIDLDEDDMFDDVLLQSAGKGRRKGKGKKKQPQFDSDDEFFEELQQAWEADRARKAERKRARLEARLANQPSKKTIKAAKRAGLEAPSFHSLKGFNIHAVHEEIRQFVLSGPSRTSDLTLQPMDKKDRVTVHLLAETYGLKSQSRGSGTKRYPCLSRTTRTSALIGPSEAAKIEHILAVSEGRQKAGYIGKAGGKRSKSLWRALQGMEPPSGDKKQKAKITSHHKNKEGDVVGGSAEHLQNDNVGYRLLARMGWNHGQSMGATGTGIAVPLAATIKTTKRGLGS